LWHLASEIAWADDDGYAHKGKMDYYAYHEVETGRMTLLEYDGNSVMENTHVNWSPFYNSEDPNYVLMYRLLNHTNLRQRYLAHLRTVIEDEMNTAECNATLDWYKAMIDTMVQNDPKKIYTYNQFVTEVGTLKNFVNTRRTVLLSNAEVTQTGPAIADAAHYAGGVAWQQPESMQTVNVKTHATSSNGIDRVTLYYSNGIVGKFFPTAMFDDGAHDDAAAGDGIYGASIPGQTAGTWVRWYVEAAADNASKTVSYMPAGAEHNVYVYQVSNPTGVQDDFIQASIDLYPNPANNVVYIKASGAENGLVEIVNALGQIVHSEPQRDVTVVDVNDLPNGIYLVRFGSVVKKLVVAH
ncbi:MAG TPA: T9SS type A sorting domain-containing protein, partial [Chitinophagales bacterium]|nr:T9SS type A sorting domain-containing protein [Chitinophagales bacterium]